MNVDIPVNERVHIQRGGSGKIYYTERNPFPNVITQGYTDACFANVSSNAVSIETNVQVAYIFSKYQVYACYERSSILGSTVVRDYAVYSNVIAVAH